MTPKKTAFLALLLALGIFLAWFFDHRGEEQQKAREAAEKKLFDFPPVEVSGLRIHAGNEEIAIARVEGEWKILSPVKTDGDADAIAALIEAAAAASVGSYLSGADASFGLNPPRAIVEFIHGGVTDTLWLGPASPTGAAVYAKSSRTNTPALLDAATASALSKDLFELRDKRLAHFEPANVRRCVITSAKGDAIALKRDAAGKWRIAAPVDAPADPAKVAELMDALRFASAMEFPPESHTSHSGMDKPRISILLAYPGMEVGEEESLLQFGNDAKNKIGIYARRHGEPIMVVPGGFIGRIPLAAADLMDLHLFSITSADATQAAVQHANGNLDLKKDADGTWRNTGTRKRSELSKVQSLLNGVGGLTFSQLAKMPAPAGEPFAKITLWGTLGAKETVAFTALKGDNTRLVAHREGEPAPFIMERAAVDRLLQTALEGL